MAKAKTEEPTATVGTWQPPGLPGRPTLAAIAAVVLLVNLPLLHYFLVRSPVSANTSLPFTDTFESSATITERYWSSGGLWRVENGWLYSPGVKQNPLWLRASLPADVAVEFDVKSNSPEGDIKVEIFGDGSDHASGYVLIHGAWNNSNSIIARLDEHAPALSTVLAAAKGADPVAAGVYRSDTRARVEGQRFRVEQGRTYRWRIERRGKLLSWFIDGQPYLSFDDPLPLSGKGHDRFGFSSWQADLYFDNLTITPL